MNDEDTIWKPLPWDTAFFGVKTARIVLPRPSDEAWAQALMACRAWGAQVIHYLAESDDDAAVRLAERSGFHLVDIRVTLEWCAPAEVARPATPLVRPYLDADLGALQVIARASYQHSRYYYDRHYPRERCDALYETWVTQDCGGRAARVLVAEREGQVRGFVTCHYDPAALRGEIGLVGMHADAQGLGLGRQLIHAAQCWFGGQGTRVVAVATQGRNVVAQRLYQASGFKTSLVQLWYHGWLEDR